MLYRNLRRIRRTLLLAIVSSVWIFSIILLLSGCAGIGLMSGLNVGNVSDVIVFKTSSDSVDILATGVDVANSMGFQITGRDIAQKMVMLQFGDLGSFRNPLPWLIGKIDNNHVTLTVINAQSLSVQVRTTGTFGSGNYNDAVRLLDEFKRRIYIRMQ